MPGFNPKTQANSARNGNNCLVMIGDQPISFAQAFTHQVPTGGEHLFGIGNAKPQEIQQLRWSPQVTVEQFELTAVGEELLAGSQNLFYLLAGKQYDIHVFSKEADGTTDAVYTYVGCKVQSASGNIPTNAPVRDTFTFLAIDVLDINGNSIMDSGDNALSILTSAAVAAAGLGANNLGIAA